MGQMKNVMKKIGETESIINPRYDLNLENVKEIANNSRGRFKLIYNGFNIGYLQGMKAAQAEMKRGM